jgi:uncharacterized membrane protein
LGRLNRRFNGLVKTYTIQGVALNIMDDLVKHVTEKTGLSEEAAKEVVEVVLDYIKERLPEPIAGQIDGLLEGKGGGLMGGLGGMFRG